MTKPITKEMFDEAKKNRLQRYGIPIVIGTHGGYLELQQEWIDPLTGKHAKTTHEKVKVLEEIKELKKGESIRAGNCEVSID